MKEPVLDRLIIAVSWMVLMGLTINLILLYRDL